MIKGIELLGWIGQRIGKPPAWERVVRIFAGPERFHGRGDFCLVRDGLAFIAQPALPIGWHITMFGTYEPELRRILGALLGPGCVAIDVGANIGWHTSLMARLVGPDGRVLAVEANPSVRERLAANLAINRLHQVEVIPCALAAGAGRVSFFGPGGDDPESANGHVTDSTRMTGDPLNLLTVEARTLDAVVEAEGLSRVDVIKIDVEGFEWPVLQGAERTLRRFKPHVVFEYLKEYADRGGATPECLTTFFDAQGYGLFSMSRNWAERLSPASWPACVDVWAVPLKCACDDEATSSVN